MYGVCRPSHSTVWTRQPVSRSLEAIRTLSRRRPEPRTVGEARSTPEATMPWSACGVNSSSATRSGRSCSLPSRNRP